MKSFFEESWAERVEHHIAIKMLTTIVKDEKIFIFIGLFYLAKVIALPPQTPHTSVFGTYPSQERAAAQSVERPSNIPYSYPA